MKKRLVLLMALGLALLLTACGGGSGGKGSAHPYSWKEKGDGSVQLTVQNAPEEGYNWNVESGGAAQAARLDDGTKNKAVFSVTGQDAGQGTVQLSCRREQAPHDVSFQILLTVQTGETGKASLTQADFQAFPAAGSAGEEGKARCVWYVDTDGGTKVYLGGGDGAYDWAVLDDDTAVLTVSGPEYDDEGGCTYQLDGVAAGETTLTLYDLRQDYGFQLQVTVDEEQSVSVASGQAGTFAVASSQVPDMDRAEELLGTLSFPQDVRVLQCRVGNWNGGEPDNYARLTLKDQAGRWQLVASKAFSAQELAALVYAPSDGAVQSAVSVGGLSAILSSTATERTLFWTDAQGRSFALSSMEKESTQEALLQLAERLCAAQQEGGGA